MKPTLKFGRGHRAFAFELNFQEQEASPAAGDFDSAVSHCGNPPGFSRQSVDRKPTVDLEFFGDGV
jgi:hypothetical protein